VLLDHLTRGRVMFGAGPGALPSDAYMMGIDPVEQRRMMQESLEAVMALFRAGPDERVGIGHLRTRPSSIGSDSVHIVS
jgi:limonene 1,2-monooxygenase